MENLSKIILDKYQVRKNQKQKDEFIALLKKHYHNLILEQNKNSKNCNIIFGDIEKAQVICTAHYDTCARLPFPNLVFPENKFLSILYSILIALPFVGFEILVMMFLIDVLSIAPLISSLISYAIMIVLLFYCVMWGPANKHTVNDNTSGVITIIELMAQISEENKKKVAFVLFDNEEKGLLGSKDFKKAHPNIVKEKINLNFDCVSDGKYMFVIHKNVDEYLEKINKIFISTNEVNTFIRNGRKCFYNSDQKNFEKSIAFVATNKGKIGYYLDKIHTVRDVVFREENINYIIEKTADYLNEI